MTPDTRITGVAITLDGIVYSLPAPNRHHNVIHYVIDVTDGDVRPYVQGFITSSGEFLDRKQAMQLAMANGQLNRRPGEQFYQGPELYSEDLW